MLIRRADWGRDDEDFKIAGVKMYDKVCLKWKHKCWLQIQGWILRNCSTTINCLSKCEIFAEKPTIFAVNAYHKYPAPLYKSLIQETLFSSEMKINYFFKYSAFSPGP